MPVGLSSTKTGEDYTYVLNGRGLVTGIVRNDDPNAFAEKYGYELTGQAFMTETEGTPVELPDRSSVVSQFLNSVLSGNLSGSLFRDWHNGTQSWIGGGHFDAALGAALNSFADVLGTGHDDVSRQLWKQISDMASMFGADIAMTDMPIVRAGGAK